MCHCKCFSFRNVHIFCEYLCESVDEKGLSACLLVNRFNDFWGKSLSDFGGILSKQFLHLSECKIGQRKIVLDIERRNRAIIVKLCDIFDPYNTKAVRTLKRGVSDVSMSERVQKTFQGRCRDAIKLVDDKDNLLPIFPVFQETLKLLKEFHH